MAYEPISEIKENHLIPLLSDYGFKVSFATDSEFSRKAIELLAHFILLVSDVLRFDKKR